MTLHEFIALNEKEQAEAVCQGEFFLFRLEEAHTILLYKVHNFYVEVFYNNATNEIERFNPFNSKKRLELYFNLQGN